MLRALLGGAVPDGRATTPCRPTSSSRPARRRGGPAVDRKLGLDGGARSRREGGRRLARLRLQHDAGALLRRPHRLAQRARGSRAGTRTAFPTRSRRCGPGSRRIAPRAIACSPTSGSDPEARSRRASRAGLRRSRGALRRAPLALRRRPAASASTCGRWATRRGSSSWSRRRGAAGRAGRLGVLEVLMDEGDRHAALADGGGHALHGAEAHVAAREDARDARLQEVRVAVERPLDRRAHVGAGEHEAAVGRARSRAGAMPSARRLR